MHFFCLPLCDIDAAWYERGEQSSPVISPLWKLINFSGALRYKYNKSLYIFSEIYT